MDHCLVPLSNKSVLLLLVSLHHRLVLTPPSLHEAPSGCQAKQGVLDDDLKVGPCCKSTPEISFPLAYHPAMVQPHGKIITQSSCIKCLFLHSQIRLCITDLGLPICIAKCVLICPDKCTNQGCSLTHADVCMKNACSAER